MTMTGHAHFDVEAFLARALADQTAVFAETKARCVDENGRRLVDHQERLATVTLEVHRWMMEAHNDHVPVETRHIAFAATMGALIASFATNLPGHPVLNARKVLDMIGADVGYAIVGASVDGRVVATSTAAPMPGGRA